MSSRRPDPVGIPPPPTRGAPLCRFSPASFPRPCVRSRLSLAHSHPLFVPSAPPPTPASVSVCLSGSPLKPQAGVCWFEGQETACLGICFPLPRLATSRPPLGAPTLKHSQKHTRTHAHTQNLTSLGFPLNTPGA